MWARDEGCPCPVDQLFGGAAGILLVEGEVRIGKSRVVDCGRAMHGTASGLFSGARPFRVTRPFGPLADAMAVTPHSADPRRAKLASMLAEDARQLADIRTG